MKRYITYNFYHGKRVQRSTNDKELAIARIDNGDKKGYVVLNLPSGKKVKLNAY